MASSPRRHHSCTTALRPSQPRSWASCGLHSTQSRSACCCGRSSTRPAAPSASHTSASTAGAAAAAPLLPLLLSDASPPAAPGCWQLSSADDPSASISWARCRAAKASLAGPRGLRSLATTWAAFSAGPASAPAPAVARLSAAMAGGGNVTPGRARMWVAKRRGGSARGGGVAGALSGCSLAGSAPPPPQLPADSSRQAARCAARKTGQLVSGAAAGTGPAAAKSPLALGCSSKTARHASRGEPSGMPPTEPPQLPGLQSHRRHTLYCAHDIASCSSPQCNSSQRLNTLHF